MPAKSTNIKSIASLAKLASGGHGSTLHLNHVNLPNPERNNLPYWTAEEARKYLAKLLKVG